MANQYNGRKDARTQDSGEMLQTFLYCAEPSKSCALVSSKSSLVSEAQVQNQNYNLSKGIYMKLIRLQTTDPQCIFDNTFNAELLVKKGSKIALKDVSINKSLSIVTITDAPENVVSLLIGNAPRAG